MISHRFSVNIWDLVTELRFADEDGEALGFVNENATFFSNVKLVQWNCETDGEEDLDVWISRATHLKLPSVSSSRLDAINPEIIVDLDVGGEDLASENLMAQFFYQGDSFPRLERLILPYIAFSEDEPEEWLDLLIELRAKGRFPNLVEFGWHCEPEDVSFRWHDAGADRRLSVLKFLSTHDLLTSAPKLAKIAIHDLTWTEFLGLADSDDELAEDEYDALLTKVTDLEHPVLLYNLTCGDGTLLELWETAPALSTTIHTVLKQCFAPNLSAEVTHRVCDLIVRREELQQDEELDDWERIASVRNSLHLARDIISRYSQALGRAFAIGQLHLFVSLVRLVGSLCSVVTDLPWRLEDSEESSFSLQLKRDATELVSEFVRVASVPLAQLLRDVVSRKKNPQTAASALWSLVWELDDECWQQQGAQLVVALIEYGEESGTKYEIQKHQLSRLAQLPHLGKYEAMFFQSQQQRIVEALWSRDGYYTGEAQELILPRLLKHLPEGLALPNDRQIECARLGLGGSAQAAQWVGELFVDADRLCFSNSPFDFSMRSRKVILKARNARILLEAHGKKFLDEDALADNLAKVSNLIWTKQVKRASEFERASAIAAALQDIFPIEDPEALLKEWEPSSPVCLRWSTPTFWSRYKEEEEEEEAELWFPPPASSEEDEDSFSW